MLKGWGSVNELGIVLLRGLNFSLQTENRNAKEMYNDYAKQMEKLLDDMSGYLKE